MREEGARQRKLTHWLAFKVQGSKRETVRLVGDGGATKVKSSPMKEIRDPPEDIRILREVYDPFPEWAAWQIPFKH